MRQWRTNARARAPKRTFIAVLGGASLRRLLVRRRSLAHHFLAVVVQSLLVSQQGVFGVGDVETGEQVTRACGRDCLIAVVPVPVAELVLQHAVELNRCVPFPFIVAVLAVPPAFL